MKVCSNCKTVNNDESKFCVSCGAEIVGSSQMADEFSNSQGFNSQNTMNQGQQFNQSMNQGQQFNQSMNQGQQFNQSMNQPYGQTNQYGYPGQNSTQKCRCKNCKTVFPSNLGVCPSCHSNNIDYKPDLWMGILSLVFGVLGGWLGILFGILGIRSAGKTGYQPLKTMSIIGIIVCVISIFVWTGIMNA